MNGNTERPNCFTGHRVLQGSLAPVPDLRHALSTVKSVIRAVRKDTLILQLRAGKKKDGLTWQ